MQLEGTKLPKLIRHRYFLYFYCITTITFFYTMDKNKYRREIESLLINIKEHFDNAVGNDHIPNLELETIVSKIEKLHQKAIIFQFLNNTNPAAFASPNIPAQAATPPAPIAFKKAIKDIRQEIGVNDKFQFIGELFHGEPKEYNAALDQINTYESLAEAETYLENLVEVYKWDESHPLVEKLHKLLFNKYNS